MIKNCLTSSPGDGIMFLSTRGLAPFKESEKCLHNIQATLLRKTFSTWRLTVTLTPARPAARPALPLTTTKGATATFATTKGARVTGFGQTGQNGGTTRCSTWNNAGPRPYLPSARTKRPSGRLTILARPRQ